jgi:hypothetical protein
VVLIITVLLAVTLGVVSGLTDMSIGDMMVKGVLTPIRTGVSKLADGAEQLYSYIFGYEALSTENEKLKEQLAQMQDDARLADSLARENERLRDMLELQTANPDYKYADAELAKKYSFAADYPQVAEAALREMFRQVGPYELDGRGIMKKGMLIRHLILPNGKFNAMDVMDFVSEAFPEDSVLFSLMSQFTPPTEGLEDYPELQCTLDADTNSRLIRYMQRRGLNGFWQEISSATEELLPDWDLTGL